MSLRPVSQAQFMQFISSDATFLGVWLTEHTDFLFKMVAIATSTFYGNKEGK